MHSIANQARSSAKAFERNLTCAQAHTCHLHAEDLILSIKNILFSHSGGHPKTLGSAPRGPFSLVFRVVLDLELQSFVSFFDFNAFLLFFILSSVMKG